METRQKLSTLDRFLAGPWLRYVLIALSGEKVIQHSFVTAALALNLGSIHSQVAVSPSILMVVGGIVGILFAVALWGLARRRAWASGLLVGLAAFDLLGEFVAQGRAMIDITLSFVVAGALLGLALRYRAQARGHETTSRAAH